MEWCAPRNPHLTVTVTVIRTLTLTLTLTLTRFTPRVSACGLFPLAMQKLSGDAAASQERRDGF